MNEIYLCKHCILYLLHQSFQIVLAFQILLAFQLISLDLILTLDHQLIFEDMESISSRTATPSTIASLQAPLMKFMVEKVLKGAELSQENIEIALVDIADNWVFQMVSRSIKSEPPPQSLLSRSSPLVWSQ